MRPIDADAFIAELREALDEEVKRIQPRVSANWMRGVHNTIEVLFKTLDKTPSVGWISAKERLPEEYTKALVATEDGQMLVAAYTSCGWMYPCYGEEPTHWMQLPPPPEGGQDD